MLVTESSRLYKVLQGLVYVNTVENLVVAPNAGMLFTCGCINAWLKGYPSEQRNKCIVCSPMCQLWKKEYHVCECIGKAFADFLCHENNEMKQRSFFWCQLGFLKFW